MGVCAYDCGDAEHTCTGWDGKGQSYKSDNNGTIPNHNLVEKCPANISKCEYRKKKTPSDCWWIKKEEVSA